MPYTQDVYVGNSHLGSSERREYLKPGEEPLSIAYFCTECGEVWARVVLREKTKPFMVYSKACAKCQSSFRVAVAGSLLLEWDPAYNDSLPPPVWLREAQIHLLHYDRWGGRLHYE